MHQPRHRPEVRVSTFVGADLLGLVLGLLRKVLTRLNLPEWSLTLKHRSAMAILLLGPLLYVALLPDAGLNHGLLGREHPVRRSG